MVAASGPFPRFRHKGFSVNAVSTRMTFLLMTLLLLLFTGTVSGQVEAEQADTPAVAIAIEDVPQQAVHTVTLLESLAPGPELDGQIAQLSAEADRLLANVELRLKDIVQALESTPKVRNMGDWEGELRSALVPLEALDAELGVRLAEVREALETVDTQDRKWSATREAATAGDASEAVIERIDATIASITTTRKQLTDVRDELLGVRDRLFDPRANIDRTLKRLETKIDGRLADIFNRDQAAVWKANLVESVRSEMREGGFASMKKRVSRLSEYVREHLATVAFQVALFLVLAVVLRSLGSRARALAEEDYDLRDASLVFALPTSMALVIALGLTIQLHPNAPYLFRWAVYTVLVVPAAIIVSRLLSRANRPIVWAMVTAFLIDRVRDFLDTVPTLERTIFLLELVAGVLFLLWLRRPSRLERVPAEVMQEPLFRTVRRLTGVAIGLFSIAIVAELIGLGDLADLIGSGTLRSAYSALFIYALLKVLQSVVAYLLILPPLRSLNLISGQRRRIRRRIDKLLAIVAALIWGYLTLDFFGMATPVRNVVTNFVSAELTIGAVAISLGDVLVLVATIWLSFALARFLDTVLNEDVFPRIDLPRGVPYAISTLTRYTLIVIGFMVALAAAGIELGKLTIIAGGLGVGIGFGLQTIVSNFVSGLILLFERPLKVGDAITVKSLTGEIRSIGIRASSIRTSDGAEVILPNSQLIAEAVTNWTFRGRRRRIEIQVGVKGGVAAQDIIELLQNVARQHKSILNTPPPNAVLTKYSESSLDFQLQVWIAEFRDEATTRSELIVAIQRALEQAGVIEPLRRIEPDSVK
jgi:potassium efflux system protein